MPEQLQTETQPSLTALVAGIINDVQQLIRQELALAKSEAKQEWDKTKSAAASFGAAAVAGVLGTTFDVVLLM
jgi:HPt (histidine-containing phosphotransfer) domain-containing protein